MKINIGISMNNKGIQCPVLYYTDKEGKTKIHGNATNFIETPSFKSKAQTVIFVLKKIVSENNGNVIVNQVDKPAMVYEHGCEYPILINPISIEDFVNIHTHIN